MSIGNNAKIKFAMAKAFFLANPETFLKIYRKVSGIRKLTAAGWKKYVNSGELNDLVYNKIITLSVHARETIAYGELAEDYGEEIHTEAGEIFIAMPFILHPIPDLVQALQKKGIKAVDEERYVLADALNQIATRAFITSLNHLVFAEMYKKPFWINKSISGGLKLDEKLDYQPVATF